MSLQSAPDTNTAIQNDTPRDRDLVADLAARKEQLLNEIGKSIVGQRQVIEELLYALLSEGHVLLVGVPGLAKTTLIRTFADILDLSFKRIQFTPDLMPSDITGTEVMEENKATGERSFRFIRGPLFANIVLADEINRTPPKTQAALLEAMQEYRVTAAGNDYALDRPFFVLATQNPIEHEGTYPLPEAQLDRFMFQINIGYPTEDEELEIVRSTTSAYEAKPEKVIDRTEIRNLQALVRRVPAADDVMKAAVSIVAATRIPESGEDKRPQLLKDYVAWGAGPRASQYLVLAGKARAILEGRTCLAKEDIHAVAGPVLRHRIIPNFRAEADGVSVHDLIRETLEFAGV